MPPADLLPERKASKPLDHYTAEEQKEIAWWLRTLKEWQQYRNKYPGLNSYSARISRPRW